MLPSISGTRLEILNLLAERPMTPSEISRSLKRSLSTVTRHLAYLEGSGLVRRVGEKRGRTRPYVKYAIKETVILVKVMEGDVGVLRLPPSEDLKMRLGVWSIPQQVFHYYVECFLWQIQDFMSSITAIGVYGPVAKGNAPRDSDIDMLILATSDVAELRRRFRTITIKRPEGESKKITTQVFTLGEFRRALTSDLRLVEALESLLPIYDPNRTLKKLRTECHRVHEEQRRGGRTRERGLKGFLYFLINLIAKRSNRRLRVLMLYPKVERGF